MRHPLAILIGFFIGVSLVIGILIFRPVYVNRCETSQYGAELKCEPHNILYVTNIVRILTHAELWTAIATIAIAFFTYTLKRSTDKLWKATRNTALAQERDTKILQRAYIATEPLGIEPFISEDAGEKQIVGHTPL